MSKASKTQQPGPAQPAATRSDPAAARPDAAHRPNGEQPAITEPPQFERAMAELEGLVDRLEGEDLTLEESLAVFERGIGLTRACQQALDAAEQRVRLLTEPSDTAAPQPFDGSLGEDR